MNAYAKVGVGLVLLLLGFAMGWVTQDWRKDKVIAETATKQANDIAAQTNAALVDLRAATAVINDAAIGAKADNTNIIAKLSTISRDVKNAKPLPVGCKPDTDRLRSLSTAVSAVNEAIARPVSSK